MRSLTHQGARYRTKLLTENRARQFARCLQANAAYINVTVERSAAAKSAYQCFFVAYQPASVERQAALLAEAQDARQARAAAEGIGYTFAADPDQPGLWWCLSTSGEVYEVTRGSCTCPDHLYRCAGAGLECKHRAALLAGLGERIQIAPARPTAAQFARDWDGDL